MTNEQTAALLAGIIARLERAIDDARDLLPPEATHTYEREATGIERSLSRAFGGVERDTITHTTIPALNPLDRLVQDLRADLSMLQRPTVTREETA